MDDKKTREFKIKARAKHGDTYGYDRTVFVHCQKNVWITCKIHGDFPQTPNNHLNGKGCPKCGVIKRANKRRQTTEWWKAEARAVHGETYGYDCSVYRGAHELIAFFCYSHGVQHQIADSHLSGRGCWDCAVARRADAARGKPRISKKEFFDRCNLVHNNFYDYRNTVFTGVNNPITVFCPVPGHGDFPIRAGHHQEGRGCRKCAIEARIVPFDEFVEKSTATHDELGRHYTYHRETYTMIKKATMMTCPNLDHGNFWQAAYAHEGGQGCPRCPSEIQIASTKERCRRNAKKRQEEAATLRPFTQEEEERAGELWTDSENIKAKVRTPK